MATRIPGSVNADSRTIQIILLSHSGRKRVNIRFCLFSLLKIVQIHDYTLHQITPMHDPRQHTNIKYTITFEIDYFTIH